MKIAVITDLHYAKEKNFACPDRMGERAKELLSAAAKRLNEEIKPDILLVGGDLVNNSRDADLLKELAEIFQTVHCPQIIIPGNHDPEPELFYQYFQRPPEFFDIAGFRILAFPDDLQTDGYNARRSSEDLARMKELCAEKPAILFQHVPLYKRDTIKCYYNYDNAEEIFESCGNVILSILGIYIEYTYIPPQTPALGKGGACCKALPCSPTATEEVFSVCRAEKEMRAAR